MYLKHTAQTQAPLIDLSRGNIKAPIMWTLEAISAIEKAKDGLVNVSLIAHPRLEAHLAFFCDASDFSMGTSLQQQFFALRPENATFRPLH